MRDSTRATCLIAATILGVAACGGTVAPTSEATDAGSESSAVDATAADAVPSPDVATPVDGSPSVDASVVEASAIDAIEDEAAPGIDEGADAPVDASPPCADACVLGDIQCTWAPSTCGPNPDGGVWECDGGGLAGVSTCVAGAIGCTVWQISDACSSTYACCVPCTPVPCVDGGPPNCSVCPEGPRGAPCMRDSDCASNACDAMSRTCASSHCTDHKVDGDETDVDCGGNTCGACPTGEGCNFDTDCQSGFCPYPAHRCN